MIALATFFECRANVNRALHSARYLAHESPEPARSGFAGVVSLLENAWRILGEIAEGENITSERDTLPPHEPVPTEPYRLEPDEDDDE